MRAVGLDPRFQARYPHSFGGQRQRIGIARALALDPDPATSRCRRSMYRYRRRC